MKKLELKSQNTITTNNIQNNTQIINNTININQLGLDNIDITKKEKIQLLESINYGEYPIVEMVKKIYNDDRFINCRNVAITDLKGKDALLYNPDINKFEHTNKHDTIDEMIIVRKVDIKNYLDDIKDSNDISDQTKRNIEEYVYKIANNKKIYQKEMKDHNEKISYAIYNTKDKMKTIMEIVNNQGLIESETSNDP